MSPRPIIIVCKTAKDPQVSGYTLGHNCTFCHGPLQISPTGMSQIRTANAKPLCNACGLWLTQCIAEGVESGKVPAPGIMLNPDAIHIIERVTGKPILEVFPNAKTHFVDE